MPVFVKAAKDLAELHWTAAGEELKATLAVSQHPPTHIYIIIRYSCILGVTVQACSSFTRPPTHTRLYGCKKCSTRPRPCLRASACVSDLCP